MYSVRGVFPYNQMLCREVAGRSIFFLAQWLQTSLFQLLAAQAPPPQRPLRLELGAPAAVTATPAIEAGTRGHYVRPDGNGARPSAVVLLAAAWRGGYGLHCSWINI
jgi:hypothetical protein